QSELEAEEKVPFLLIAARGERGILDGALQAIQSGDLDPRFLYVWEPGTNTKTIVALITTSIRYGQVPRSSTGTDVFVDLFRVPGMAQRIRAALLKHNSRVVEIAKLPVEQQAEHLKAWHAAERDLPKLARPIVSTWSKRTDAFLRGQANLRCAVAML